MSFSLWAMFYLSTLMLDIAPGPAVMLIVSAVVGGGYAKGLRILAGLEIGSCIWFSVAVASLLMTNRLSPSFLNGIGFAGAVYLGYLGLRSFGAVPDLFALAARRKTGVSREKTSAAATPVRAGLMTQLANPKSYLYWLAFLPQFQPNGGPTLAHNLGLLAVAQCSTVPVSLLYIGLANRARRLVVATVWQRRLDHLSGAVLVALSLWLLGHYVGFL